MMCVKSKLETRLKIVEHKLEVVEENVEAKIDVSCCALEARVEEKLVELTSSVEDRIKPLSELTHKSIVDAVDTYIVVEKDKEERRLNVIVHNNNVPESTFDEGQERSTTLMR